MILAEDMRLRICGGGGGFSQHPMALSNFLVTDSVPPEEICSFIEKITLSPGIKNSSYILYLSSVVWMPPLLLPPTRQSQKKSLNFSSLILTFFPRDTYSSRILGAILRRALPIATCRLKIFLSRCMSVFRTIFLN